MKKSLLILIAVVFVAAISSCKKTYVTPNTNTTVYRTISANSWILDQTENAYRAELSIPQLDQQYNDDGAVLVYISYGSASNGSAPVYEQLPQVYQGASFSYYHTDGKIVIYSQTPGGNPATPPNQNVLIKVVLIDSNASDN